MSLSERQRAISEGLAFDDAGLFRSGIVQVVVEVTPQSRTTRDGDLVVRGFVGKKEIEVVFPGQRQLEAAPMIQRMHQRLQAKRRELVGADPLSIVSGLRQRLRIDGIWRVRMLAELNGMPVRRFQLVAARWRYRSAEGVEHLCGHLPSA
ncbi:MAG: hypothetical protein HKN18_11690 [Silicimonas sp.]|nr:hypothetical protein [Silicimonas sp.]